MTDKQYKYKSYMDVITEGSNMFKYGLLWWFGLSANQGYDYGYVDELEHNNIEQTKLNIYDMFKPCLPYMLQVIRRCELHQADENDRLANFVYSLKYDKFGNNNLSLREVLLSDVNIFVQLLSDKLYYYLMNPSKCNNAYFQDDVQHAANRVIRNYNNILCHFDDVENKQHVLTCMRLISDYYKKHNITSLKIKFANANTSNLEYENYNENKYYDLIVRKFKQAIDIIPNKIKQHQPGFEAILTRIEHFTPIVFNETTVIKHDIPNDWYISSLLKNENFNYEYSDDEEESDDEYSDDEDYDYDFETNIYKMRNFIQTHKFENIFNKNILQHIYVTKPYTENELKNILLKYIDTELFAEDNILISFIIDTINKAINKYTKYYQITPDQCFNIIYCLDKESYHYKYFQIIFNNDERTSIFWNPFDIDKYTSYNEEIGKNIDIESKYSYDRNVNKLYQCQYHHDEKDLIFNYDLNFLAEFYHKYDAVHFNAPKFNNKYFDKTFIDVNGLQLLMFKDNYKPVIINGKLMFKQIKQYTHEDINAMIKNYNNPLGLLCLEAHLLDNAINRINKLHFINPIYDYKTYIDHYRYLINDKYDINIDEIIKLSPEFLNHSLFTLIYNQFKQIPKLTKQETIKKCKEINKLLYSDNYDNAYFDKNKQQKLLKLPITNFILLVTINNKQYYICHDYWHCVYIESIKDYDADQLLTYVLDMDCELQWADLNDTPYHNFVKVFPAETINKLFYYYDNKHKFIAKSALELLHKQSTNVDIYIKNINFK